MKFSQYDPQVNPNTIQGQVQRPGDLNSYGGNGAGYEAIGRGLGAANEAYNKFIESVEQSKVVEADAEYDKRISNLLYNPKDGLMHAQYSNAEGIAGKFQNEEQKIRQEIMEKYKFSLNKTSSVFNNWANNDAQKRFMLVGQHEYKQVEANKDLALSNNIDENFNFAMQNYDNDELIKSEFDKSITILMDRYAGQDPEFIKSEAKRLLSPKMAALVGTALANDDIDRAGAIIEKWGAFMPAETRLSYSRIAHARKEREYEYYTGLNIYERFGDDYESARKYIYGDNFGYDGEAAVRSAREDIGNNYGTNTCTIRSNNWIAAGGGKEGNAWAPTQFEDMKGAGLIFTDKSQLRSGDIVYWHYGEDPNDVDHVGIYDAKTGMVIQSGDHGVAEIPLDYANISGFARPRGRNVSIEDKEKAWNAYVTQAHNNNAIKNNHKKRIIDSVQQEMWNKFKTGVIDPKEFQSLVYSVSGGDADIEMNLLKFGDDLIGIQGKAAAAVSNSSIYKEIKDAITNSTVTPAEAVSLINQNATVLGEADRSRLLAFARNQDPRNKDIDKQLATIINEAFSDPVERGEAQIFLDNKLEIVTDPDARYTEGYDVLYGTKDRPGILQNKAIFKNFNSKQREWGSLKSSLSPKLYPYIDAYQIQNGNNIDLGQAKTIFESINPNDKYQISALQYATVYNSPMDIQELNKQIAAMAVRDGVDAAPHLLDIPQQSETVVQQNESTPWFSDWGASERTGLAAMSFSDTLEAIKQRHLAALRGEINEE